MKYIKEFKENDNTNYKIGDIVVCSTEGNNMIDYRGYINKDGKFIKTSYVTYGRKYKILRIYSRFGDEYNEVSLSHHRKHYVDVISAKGDVYTNLDADIFSIASKWKKPDDPMIGDYVLANRNFINYKEVNEYLQNNIGRYVKYGRNGGSGDNGGYIIQYKNIPNNKTQFFWNTDYPIVKGVGNITLMRDEIIYFSPNKDDLEMILNLKKYNL